MTSVMFSNNNSSSSSSVNENIELLLLHEERDEHLEHYSNAYISDPYMTTNLTSKPSPSNMTQILYHSNMIENANNINDDNHILRQSKPENRSKSCPIFSRCDNLDHSKNTNRSRDNHQTNNFTSCNEIKECTVVCPFSNSNKQKSVPERQYYDDENDVHTILHCNRSNEINGNDTHSKRHSENVSGLIQNALLTPSHRLMPSPPLWTSLAMRDRMVCTPFAGMETNSILPQQPNKPETERENIMRNPETESIDARPSTREVDNVTMNNNWHHMSYENQHRTQFGSRQSTMMSETMPSDQLSLHPSLFKDVKSNIKLYDDRIRYFLFEYFSRHDNKKPSRNCETHTYTNNWTTIQDDAIMDGFVNRNGIFGNANNETDNCCDSWSYVLDKVPDGGDVLSRYNEEMNCDCSTDEDIREEESLRTDRNQGLFANRPINPVALVLEFGDSEHLIPILQDGNANSTGIEQ